MPSRTFSSTAPSIVIDLSRSLFSTNAVAVTVSPLPGPSGNVEFFLLLRHGPARIGANDIRAEVERAASLGVAGEKVDP